VLGVSVYSLAQKLASRNVEMVRLVGRVSGVQTVTYRGHECRVEPVIDEATQNTTALRVHWRGQTIDYPTWLPPGDGEGLEPFKEWFGLMVLADGAESDATARDNWTGDHGPDTRLVAIARYPAEGFDPGSWGLVRRQDWHYRLAQLNPEGPDDQAIEQWDKTYGEIDAIFMPGKYTKRRHPEWIMKSREERHEKLWMYYAMVEITPPMQFRGRDKASEGIVASMGWAWPAASGGCIGLVAGIALWASGRMSRAQIA